MTNETDDTDTQGAPAASIAMMTIDCPDPKAMGDFWGPLLGMEVGYADENAVMLTGPSGPALGFGKEEHFTPPSWPDEKTEKQFHLDLKVDDLATAEQRCLELGATKPDHQPGDTWVVLLDPAGHPFCLTLWQM